MNSYGTRDSLRSARDARDLGTRLSPRLIVGMGATGASVARYFARSGFSFVATDSRAQPPCADQFDVAACCMGKLASPLPLSEIAEAVVSPGISLQDPFIQELRAAGVPVIGDIELFARALTPPHAARRTPHVIAITGSNGKSTVTALVTEMARAAGINVAVGGNFGTPALDLLDPDVALYVLELSSFQLELTASLAAQAACVLNVSPDHIDRHGALAHYAALKARVYTNAGAAVINRDDPLVLQMSPQKLAGAATVSSFGVQAPDNAESFGLRELEGTTWLARGAENLLPENELKLRGRHNVLNALAALALGTAAGLPRSAMLEALRHFAGLPHRCQWVASIRGVDWVNDSKGTNVGAMLASLEGLPGPIVLLAGGQAKGGDFNPVAPVLARKGRLALLFGVDAGYIEQAIQTHVAVRRVAGMQDAVSQAADAAQPGDTVLLSPGCASFDMFRDYQDRGEQFTAAVAGLAA